MDKFKLIELFNLVKTYGNIVRRSEKDGLESWQHIKKISDDKNILTNGWNINVYIEGELENNLDNIFKYVHDKLKMYGDDGEESYLGQTKNNWQKSHFLLQLIRLPLRNKCTLLRILQIAYNIGQFLEEHEQSPYPEECINYFKINNLNNLKSYINLDLNLVGLESVDIDLIIDIMYKILNKKSHSGGRMTHYMCNKIKKYEEKIKLLENA